MKVTYKFLPKVKGTLPKVYSSDKAQAYLLRLAADLVEDGEFLLEAMEIGIVGLSPISLGEDNFIHILKYRLEWDDSFVQDALDKVSE